MWDGQGACKDFETYWPFTHHIRTNKDFVKQGKSIKFEERECNTSYDVRALFTSVPVDPGINIIKKKLEQDADLPNRTSMPIPNIIALLGFCLKNTFPVPG